MWDLPDRFVDKEARKKIEQFEIVAGCRTLRTEKHTCAGCEYWDGIPKLCTHPYKRKMHGG